MLSYSKNYLLSLRCWYKVSTQVQSQGLRQTGFQRPAKQLSLYTWLTMKSMGILRKVRGSRGGQFTSNNSRIKPRITTYRQNFCLGKPTTTSTGAKRDSLTIHSARLDGPNRNNLIVIDLLNIQVEDKTPSLADDSSSITIQDNQVTQRPDCLNFVPSFLLSNTMSLAPKIDEIRSVVLNHPVDFACFTETWLTDLVHNNVINIPGFNIVRRDRVNGQHGGVCCYVNDSIPYEVLSQYHHDLFEVLWIKARPFRLPRGFSSIIIGIVYHPPSSNAPAMNDYLFCQLSAFESSFPNTGTVLLGDFNKLSVSGFSRHFRLKQLVNFPTRGNNTLDLILTDLKEYYSTPEKLSSFGLSDHLTILLKPKTRRTSQETRIIRKIRDLRPSNRTAFSTFINEIDWSILNQSQSCADKLITFETIIRTGMDILLPLESMKSCSNEPAWITPSFKSLITQRQEALTNGDTVRFKVLRNRVNRERKKCRATFFHSKVKHLKELKPALWWKHVKSLCGMDPTSPSNELRLLMSNDNESTGFSHEQQKELAERINQAFLSPMASFTTLPSRQEDPSQIEVSALEDVCTENSVFLQLLHLKPSKAPGPDGLPPWIFKENADVLSKPVNDILNRSFRERGLPASWKMANVTPLSKQKPVLDINLHLRPISLTPVLSKVAEEVIVEGYVKPAILKIVDGRQFGTVPRSSTTQALISIIHQLSSSTDGNGALVRLALLDFKKAFDLVDHHILKRKLESLDLPSWVVFWVIDFLTDRQQRVKLGNDVYSSWSSVPAGVPQGTKLGPWLYLLMINDLDTDGNDLWKYVDDLTATEVVPKGSSSEMQTTLNSIEYQSVQLKFTLNEKKCKEMRIQFSRVENFCHPLTINHKELEIVSYAKVLGVIISNDLKWNNHIECVIKRSSKRLYFLRQLKRAKVPRGDMIYFYSSCIRSIIEYAAPVFHYALPRYLSDDLERIQKRALFIILGPEISYSDGLEITKLCPLSDRRQALCQKLFRSIMNDPNHKLYNLLPTFNVNARYSLRHKRFFIEPRYSTNRFRNSFIPASVHQFNM